MRHKKLKDLLHPFYRYVLLYMHIEIYLDTNTFTHTDVLMSSIHHMASHHITSYHIISHHITSHHTTPPYIMSQDTRLNNRWLDLRVPSNNAIMRIKSGVSLLFRYAIRLLSSCFFSSMSMHSFFLLVFIYFL